MHRVHSVRSWASLACWALICCLLTVGCGPAKASLSGKVTSDGQPLNGGSLVFITPEGKGGAVTVNIQPDGTYSTDQLPYGELKVVVTYVENPTTMPNVGAKGGKGPNAPEGMPNPYANLKKAGSKPKKKVAEKYTKLETTPLSVNITQSKQTKDFELE